MQKYDLNKVDNQRLRIVNDGHIFMSEKFFHLLYTDADAGDFRPFRNMIYEYHGLDGIIRNSITERDKDGKVKFNYIDIRRKDKGMVSFMPGNREQKMTADGKWSLDGRQTIKFGRFLKAFFPPQLLEKHGIDDKLLEKYGSVVKGSMSGDDYEIKILDGQDIKWAYLADNYLDEGMLPGSNASSAIWSSCMRYKKCQHWLDVYVEEERIKCVAMIHKATGKLVSRALLWEDVHFQDYESAIRRPYKFEEQITFMDRIYAYREWMIEFMLDWATDQGYWRKKVQSADTKERFMQPNGDERRGYLKFELKKDNYQYFPYMDTLAYAPHPINMLYNSEKAGPVNTIKFVLNDHSNGNAASTGARRPGDCECAECNQSGFYSSDLRYVSGYGDICNSCIDNEFSWSEYHNEYIRTEDAIYVDSEEDYFTSQDVRMCAVRCEYILRSDSVEARNHNGQWVYMHRNETVRLVNGDFYVKDHDEVYYLEGGYYHADDTFTCAYDGDLYPISRSIFIHCDEVDVHESNVQAYCDANGISFNENTGEYQTATEVDNDSTESTPQATNESIIDLMDDHPF